MALYGTRRDASLIRHLNRELLHNIISQQVALYKVNVEKTKPNIYGEAAYGRYYSEPVLLNCLIQRTDPNFDETNIGRDFNRTNTYHFLRDDLIDAGIYPELGDVVFYYGNYYEIEQSFDNRLFTGKDPDYNYAVNPLNPGLEEYGYSVSISVVAHYVTAEKIGIEKGR